MSRRLKSGGWGSHSLVIFLCLQVASQAVVAPVPAGGIRSLAQVHLPYSVVLSCPGLVVATIASSCLSPSLAPQQFKVQKPVPYIKLPVLKGLGWLWFYTKALCYMETTSRAVSGSA